VSDGDISIVTDPRSFLFISNAYISPKKTHGSLRIAITKYLHLTGVAVTRREGAYGVK
jgi:hypothetical protein